MLAKRIIPTFLHRGSTLVKGVGFDSWRSVGNVQQAARIYAARGVDELIILNINATPSGVGPELVITEKITEGSFTPVTVGGGVKTVDDVRHLLNAGADKVAICTAIRLRPQLIDEIAKRFGSQALCAVIEFDGNSSVRDIARVAKQYADRGAGEILLQATDRDGTMEGYHIGVVEDVSSAIDVPLIISGGCADYEDMCRAIKAGADAVAAGALYQFTDCTPRGAAEYLHQKGVCVRL